jgi:AraC-like DNA-binding protein
MNFKLSASRQRGKCSVRFCPLNALDGLSDTPYAARSGHFRGSPNGEKVPARRMCESGGARRGRPRARGAPFDGGPRSMIAALVTGAVARTRLGAAVYGHPRETLASEPIIWCDDSDALYDAVASHEVTVAVVELSDHLLDGEGADANIEGIVHALRTESPAITVLVYGPLTPRVARGALAAGRGGATEIILAGYDDVGRALAPFLARAKAASAASRAIARLSDVASDEVLRVLTYALRHARHAPSVADVARALRVHRKTLAAWCLGSGAPPPGVLVSWCRLIVAADHLAQPGRPTERVAVEVGFRSGSSLANMLKRRTGLTRVALRKQGGSVVLEMLVRQLGDSGPATPVAVLPKGEA